MYNLRHRYIMTTLIRETLQLSPLPTHKWIKIVAARGHSKSRVYKTTSNPLHSQ